MIYTVFFKFVEPLLCAFFCVCQLVLVLCGLSWHSLGPCVAKTSCFYVKKWAPRAALGPLPGALPGQTSLKPCVFTYRIDATHIKIKLWKAKTTCFYVHNDVLEPVGDPPSSEKCFFA